MGSGLKGGVEVYKCGLTPAEDEILPPMDEECEMQEWGLRLVKSENEVHVIGGSSVRDYETRSYSASVNDEEMRAACQWRRQIVPNGGVKVYRSG